MTTKKKTINKKILTAVAAGCLMTSMTMTGLASMPVQATETTAQTEPANNDTAIKNGWEGSKYYKDGAIVKGWQTIDGKKYYFDTSTGDVKKGWQTISNARYYFDVSTGVMKTYSQVIDGKTYYFNANGVMQTGWIKFSSVGKWRYFGTNGAMLTGWQKVENVWYYLNPSDGYMLTDTWQKDSKGWCYLGADGKQAKNSWAKKDGEWYYLNGNGYIATNTWAQDSKGWCRLGSDGKIIKDKWIQVDNCWYFLKANGYMASNEWAQDSKGWCYLGANGKQVKSDWVKWNDNWYYINANGYMVTNAWQKDSVGWCWLGSDGKQTKNKWIKDGNDWYYLKANGYMAANTWAKDSSGWRWLQGDGKMATWISSAPSTTAQTNNRFPFLDNSSDVYNYCPSVIKYGNTYYIFYTKTHHDTYNGKPTWQDYIYLRRCEATYSNGKWTGWKYSPEKRVLTPTEGTFDSHHVCDPNVIAGSYTYNGKTYRYIMSYLATTHANADACKNNEVGIAVSNDMVNWVKVKKAVPSSSAKGSWGVGQPSFIKDKDGNTILTYTADGAGIQARSVSNSLAVGGAVTVSSNGLSNFHNADFAVEKDSSGNIKYLYVVYDSNWTNASVSYISNSAAIYRTKWNGTLNGLKNLSWEKVKIIGKDQTGYNWNHNSCLTRDLCGEINERSIFSSRCTSSGTYHEYTYRIFNWSY